MELQSWPGDWNLPSIDTRCLEVLAYAKFAGCPINVNRNNNPWKSPLGEFPVLRSGGDILTAPDKIMDYFRLKNFNADYQLNAKQQADTLALVSLVRSKLYPAISFTFWVDERNYTKFTRPWFSKRLPFPLNYFLPGKMSRQKRKEICEGVYSHEIDDLQLENKLLKEALECLKLLSIVLGDKDFFFSHRPTTLDAVVFSHLAVIYKAPLPNNKLHNYLQGYDNLSTFCRRVLQRYFSPETEEQQRQQDQPSAKRSSSQDDAAVDRNSESRSTTILAVVFAVVTMTAYAFISGLVEVKFTRTKNSYSEESTPELGYTFEGEHQRNQNRND